MNFKLMRGTLAEKRQEKHDDDGEERRNCFTKAAKKQELTVLGKVQIQ